MRILFLACLCFSAFAQQICLCVLVDHDDVSVLHCINSARNIVNCVCVCDFGASESMKTSIHSFFEECLIPYVITKNKSVPYTQRKSVGISLAKEMIGRLRLDADNTYILVVEQNQLLKLTSPLSHLTEASYFILEKSESLACHRYNPNLFLASSNLSQPRNKLKVLTLEEWANPLNPERNIQRFTEAVREDPENKRYLLYLAQSYKSAKKYEEAADHFQERIRSGGDAQEIWFAKYMLGECYAEMGRWPDALNAYLEAYQTDPKRGDSIFQIAKHYRWEGKNDLAYLFANHGLLVPALDDQLLSPLQPLYDYQYDEELSIAAYYTSFRNEGFEAVNRLVLRRNVPDWIRDQAYRNSLFYTSHIKSLNLPIHIPLPPIEGDENNHYHPMNPSIVKTDDGYELICRSVNYTQKGAKHFTTPDPDWIFRTRNFLVKSNQEFQFSNQQEIIEDLQRERWNSFSVEGLEDCRLFHMDDERWFTCTTFDTNPTGAIQISLGKIDSEGNVEQLIPLKGPDPYRCEKNWLPFMYKGELHIVYLCTPFTILKPDLETGVCEKVLERDTELDFSRFRGSAAPILFDEGYLMLVHEVALLADYSRVYLHRFVYLDDDFRITKISKPFTFMHQGVEFCLSMTMDHSGKQIILPIGIEDNEAWLVFVDLEDVRSMLESLP